MSEFMKNIVSEVLQRNHQPFNTDNVRVTACEVESKSDCPHTCAQPSNCRKPPPEVKRPNYQKERAARRTALIGGAAAAVPGGAAAIAAGAASSPPEAAANAVPAAPAEPHNRLFAEQCLSPLLLHTLPVMAFAPRKAVENILEKSAAPVPASPYNMNSPGVRAHDLPAGTHGSPEPFRLLQHGEMEGWLFPEISSRLRPLLGISGRSYRAAGVLSSPVCHPGQLFIAEELLPPDPDLEADISWSPGGSGFELKLFSHEPGRIGSLLTEIAACIQREAARFVQVYLSLKPGPLVRRYLGAGQQEALAVIDAGSRWSSVGTAEQLLYNHPNNGLNIRTEQSYCIVSGASAQIRAVEPDLKCLLASVGPDCNKSPEFK